MNCEKYENFTCKVIKRKEKLTLLETYACAPNLKTPKLNIQISATMKETTRARDDHMVKIKDISGIILKVIGSLLTKIYDNREKVFGLTEILEPL